MLRAFFVLLAACAPAGKGDMGDPGSPGEAGPMGTMGDPGPAGPGQKVKEVLGTGQLVVAAGTTAYTLIPGMTMAIDVPDGLVVWAHTEGGIQCTGTGNAFSVVDLALFVDGLQTTAVRRVVAANTAGLAQVVTNWSFGKTLSLAPGSHVLEVRAISVDPAAAAANVSSAAAPQLQGQLMAMLLQPAS